MEQLGDWVFVSGVLPRMYVCGERLRSHVCVPIPLCVTYSTAYCEQCRHTNHSAGLVMLNEEESGTTAAPIVDRLFNWPLASCTDEYYVCFKCVGIARTCVFSLFASLSFSQCTLLTLLRAMGRSDVYGKDVNGMPLSVILYPIYDCHARISLNSRYGDCSSVCSQDYHFIGVLLPTQS